MFWHLYRSLLLTTQLIKNEVNEYISEKAGSKL